MRAFILIALITLSGCRYLESAEYVRMSKGDAGGVSSLLTGAARYCQITTGDQEHQFSEIELQAFYEFCSTNNLEIAERLLNQ